MRDVAAVRELIPQLSESNIDVVLLNIHTAPADAMLERFDFKFTPTYLIYDDGGIEVLRSNRLPSLDEIISN